MNEETKLVPYTNSTYGFTISYPDNWKIEHQDDNVTTFLLPEHRRPGPFKGTFSQPLSPEQGSFSISVDSADTPLLELVQEDIDSSENKPLISEFKVRYRSRDMKPGYIVKFTDRQPFDNLELHAYVIIGNNLYTFEYSDDPFDFGMHWSDVINTISSLDLIRK